MTTNEKLDLVLAEMKNMKQELKQDIQDVKQELKQEIQEVKHRVTSIELHLENETDKNIRILAENYLPAAKRYEKATGQIETMQSDIDVMKSVITEHSRKLNQIA